MSPSVELISLVIVALPALYAGLCLFLRASHARKTAAWVQANHPERWSGLHALARGHAWAGIEILIKKGLLTGEQIEEFRRRDEQLEKHSWLGMLSSALLALLFALFVGAFAGPT